MRVFAPELEPKLLTVLREGYPRHALGRDLLAGVVVGIVALPLAIAFAIASGVRPEQGLYTAIVAGFLISALGGSRVQIGGPTGAFVVIVAGVVAQHGYDGLAVATVMAGVLLVLMAIARLGEVLRFVPYPVTVGFTSGIAIIIAVGQVGDALGLALARAPADFLERCRAYAGAIGTVNWAAAGVCAGTILVVQFWPRVNRRIPGPLVALLATTAAVRALGLDVDTIGSRFGEIPTGLPAPRLPRVDWSHLSALVSPAVSIALLGGIESLLSALVADGQIGGRHRSNAELMGQGIANIVSPIFGGIPATGAIARTATNVRNGGRTPVAGIAHAATLLVIVLVAGRWAVYIPIATLAGILLLVAYNMSEWRVFAQLLRSPRSDVLVLMTTFALTVAVDLTVAIQAGVVLAALLFMRRMAAVTQVKAVPNLMDYEGAAGAEGEAEALAIPDGVEVFAVNGSFCFGAARKFTETLAVRRSRPRAVILDLKNVIAMDATGLHALEDVVKRLRGQGARVLVSGAHAQPLSVMARSGALERIGTDQLFGSVRSAVEEVARVPEA